MKKIAFILTIISIATLTILPGCHKDNNTNNTATTGTLSLHIHGNIDTSEVEADIAYDMPNQAGTATRKITIHTAAYTISNIKLVKSNGDIQTVTGSATYAFGTEEYNGIGTVPTGNYKSITFDVTNLAISGMVDTSATGNHTPNKPYSLTQGATATVTLPVHTPEFTVTENLATTIHLTGNFAVTLGGIDFTTTQTGNSTTAATITTNVPSMFEYEQ